MSVPYQRSNISGHCDGTLVLLLSDGCGMDGRIAVQLALLDGLEVDESADGRRLLVPLPSPPPARLLPAPTPPPTDPTAALALAGSHADPPAAPGNRCPPSPSRPPLLPGRVRALPPLSSEDRIRERQPDSIAPPRKGWRVSEVFVCEGMGARGDERNGYGMKSLEESPKAPSSPSVFLERAFLATVPQSAYLFISPSEFPLAIGLLECGCRGLARRRCLRHLCSKAVSLSPTRIWRRERPLP